MEEVLGDVADDNLEGTLGENKLYAQVLPCLPTPADVLLCDEVASTSTLETAPTPSA